ncbi:MAG: hypothetical protein K5756_04585 [Clostridiales bacterium]|nr:hypothetical protein [Clostridiales bacterium]
MASVVEIMIKKGPILAEATALELIAKSVSSKKIVYTANSSKGRTADSLNELIKELNSMVGDLAKLMHENANNVRRIAEQFASVDTNIAAAFKG